MPLKIRCREITESDVDGVVDLLAHGFPHRPRAFWADALTLLAGHRPPAGYPQYGYLLEHEGAPAGVVITIFSRVSADGGEAVRCSVSSWYVKPEFRCYAAMLSSHALARPEVSYVNITPGPQTFAILEAQGYRRYCEGRFIAVPAVGAMSRTKVASFDGQADESLSPFESELLAEHEKYGCISVTCSAQDGRHPFVFATRRTTRAPAAYLTYCRDIDDFVRFAGPLGRYLAWRGHPLVILDANGPVRGLVGKYYGQWPKYYKGADEPRLGDLAYTERPIFGV
jgi:hypothetical protein